MEPQEITHMSLDLFTVQLTKMGTDRSGGSVREGGRRRLWWTEWTAERK